MKNFSFLIFLLFGLFLISRIYPYINNSIPLGYDGGIYLYLFKVFPNIPNWQVMDFAPGFFAIFYPLLIAGVNPELLLIPISIISQIFLFISIYFVSKKLSGEKTALITSLLFTVSLIQFRTFWFFYVKNTFALGFLLIAFYLLIRKNFTLSVIFGIILCLFHLPTAFIYFLTIFLLLFFDRKYFTFYLKVLLTAVLLGMLYYLPNFKVSILPFLDSMIKSLTPIQIILGEQTAGGTFYDIQTSFLMTIFYLPFAFIGFYILRKKASLKPFLIAFVLLLLIVITQFFFSRRYFISFDIFIIFFAGIGLNFAIEKYKNYKDIFYFYFAILILFISAFVLKTGQPLITQPQLNEIKNFGKINKGYILSTSKEDNSWLLGYTNLPLIAFEYGGHDIYWSRSEWLTFLEEENLNAKINLLKKLPKPLYLFANDKNLLRFESLKGKGCLENVSFHFFKVTCN